MWILQEEGVTVENGAANHYTATVIGWSNCVAEGSTREEAMTLYVLDTDHISLYQKSHPPVVARLKLVAPADLAGTVVSAEEQLRGWFDAIRQANSGERLQ